MQVGRRARAFDRAFDLLAVFGEQCQWGVRELSRKLELPTSTVHALLVELADVGLLERLQGGNYRLGHRAIPTGRALLEGYDAVAVATPILQSLAEATGESVRLARLDGSSVFYETKVDGASRFGGRIGGGQYFAAHAAATGKVLLAHSPDLVMVLENGLEPVTANTITDPRVFQREVESVRKTGVAIDLEEMELGAACIATLVCGPIQHAISISGPVERIEAGARELQAKLQAAAKELGEILSGGRVTLN
jgi:DNA-binding IclR family transcriptional regulator